MNSRMLVAVLLISIVLPSAVYAADPGFFEPLVNFFDFLFGTEEAEEPRFAPGDIGPINIIDSTQESKATLGYPNRKMFMDTSDSNHIWALVADDRDQLLLTEDGGNNWNYAFDYDSGGFDVDYALQIRYSMSYHAALSGDSSNNLFVTYPVDSVDEIYYLKVSAPSNTSNEVGPEWLVNTDTGILKRSDVLVTDTDVWIFSRTAGDSVGNLRYFRYDKDNNLQDSGFVEDTSNADIRVGSIDYLGNPIVVVWYGGDSAGQEKIRYFTWGGASFQQPADSMIWSEGDFGCDINVADDRTREYSFAIAGDELHVAWSCTEQSIKHAWKQMGVGAVWNSDDVVSGYTQMQGGANAWFTPVLTSRGNDIYAFYSLNENNDKYQSNMYYNKWDGSGDTWLGEVQITTDSNSNRIPNTVPVVNSDFDFIPVMWTSGTSGPYPIYVQMIYDPILPPCVDNDLDGYDNCTIGSPGDDGNAVDCVETDNDCITLYITDPTVALPYCLSNKHNINPGMSEICGNSIVDDNCGGGYDEGGCVSCVDLDGDTYFISYDGTTCNPEDCNDADPNLWPTPTYDDIDLDYFGQGYNSDICDGNPDVEALHSLALSLNNDDCNDTDVNINPDAVEICDDGIDNDCDTDFDCDDSNCTGDPSCPTCVDVDTDGYGVCPDCNIASGCTFDGDDCDDGNISINPGATEVCNNVDDNCVGGIDEGLTQSCGSGNCVGSQTCTAGAWGACDSSGTHPQACSICDVTGTEIEDLTYTDGCGASYCSVDVSPPYGDLWNYPTCNAINDCTWNVDDCYWNYTNPTEYFLCDLGDVYIYGDNYSCSFAQSGCYLDQTNISLRIYSDCTKSCVDMGNGVFYADECSGAEITCPSGTLLDACNGGIFDDYSCSGVDYVLTPIDCDTLDYTTGLNCQISGFDLIQLGDDYSCLSSPLGCGIAQSDQNTGLSWTCDALNECTTFGLTECGQDYNCYFSNAGSYTWGSGYETDEATACSDTYDNDCDTEYDYDGSGDGVIKGDSDCAVEVTGILVSDTTPVEDTVISVNCTSSVAGVASVKAMVESTDCTLNTWNSNIAAFDCDVGSPGVKDVTCYVDTSISYQSGSNQVQSIDVQASVVNCRDYDGDLLTCASYQGSGICEWCPNCNAEQTSSLGVDACVDFGTCSYSCISGSCTATCDDGETSETLSCSGNSVVNETYGCASNCSMELTSYTTTPCAGGDTCVGGVCIPSTADLFNVTLSPGWNFVSVPLEGIQNSDVSQFSYDTFLSYSDGWLLNYPGIISQISDFDTAGGYIIYSDSVQVVEFAGTFNTAYSHPLTSYAWNLVGVMEDGVLVTDVYGAGNYTVYGWTGSDYVDVTAQTLDRGSAYWVYAGEAQMAPPFDFWAWFTRLFSQ